MEDGKCTLSPKELNALKTAAGVAPDASTVAPPLPFALGAPQLGISGLPLSKSHGDNCTGVIGCCWREKALEGSPTIPRVALSGGLETCCWSEGNFGRQRGTSCAWKRQQYLGYRGGHDRHGILYEGHPCQVSTALVSSSDSAQNSN